MKKSKFCIRVLRTGICEKLYPRANFPGTDCFLVEKKDVSTNITLFIFY